MKSTSNMVFIRLILSFLSILVLLIVGFYFAFLVIEKPDYIALPADPPIGKWYISEQLVETREEYARYFIYRQEAVIQSKSKDSLPDEIFRQLTFDFTLHVL